MQQVERLDTKHVQQPVLCSGTEQNDADACADAAGAQELQRRIEAIFQDLQQRGYMQRWQVVWGQDSMELPYRWEGSGSDVQRTCSSAAECLRSFQVCDCTARVCQQGAGMLCGVCWLPLKIPCLSR